MNIDGVEYVTKASANMALEALQEKYDRELTGGKQLEDEVIRLRNDLAHAKGNNDIVRQQLRAANEQLQKTVADGRGIMKLSIKDRQALGLDDIAGKLQRDYDDLKLQLDAMETKLAKEVAAHRLNAKELNNESSARIQAVSAQRAAEVKLQEIAEAFMLLHNLSKDVVGPKAAWKRAFQGTILEPQNEQYPTGGLGGQAADL